MENKNIPEAYGLRIGMRGGGCAGMSFQLGFDKKKDSDLEYQVQGLPVYVEKRHLMYLLDITLDFYEGADARGFTFLTAQKEEKATQEA